MTINGPTGAGNPQRQGLNSALLGEGRGPLNVLGGIPTVATDYSPLWDVNLGQWTQEAIDKGYRSRVTEEFQILGSGAAGLDHRPRRRAVRLDRGRRQLPDRLAVPLRPSAYRSWRAGSEV